MNNVNLDTSVLCSLISDASSNHIRSKLSDAGYPELRDRHGYIFQRLLVKKQSISELTASLHITQQAVTKFVNELEKSGYVSRSVDGYDKRIRYVALTQKGRDAVKAARQIRAALDEELRIKIGSAEYARMKDNLEIILGVLGYQERILLRTAPLVRE